MLGGFDMTVKVDEQYPLVSILIPAYNRTTLLVKALKSAIHQTYKNIEIIIGDDSTNDDVRKVIEPYLQKDNRIKYFSNGGCLGFYGAENARRCLSVCKGEFINYLDDDDIFVKDKIEKMAQVLRNNPEVKIVTSHRGLIDDYGNIMEERAFNKRLCCVDTVFEGRDIITRILMENTNFVGEPTTAMFRKADIEDYGVFNGKKYSCLVDVSMWIQLLSKGKCMYITETLSYFRIHSTQNTQKMDIQPVGMVEWKNLIQDSYTKGLLTKEEYFTALSKWGANFSYYYTLFMESPQFKSIIEETTKRLEGTL